MTTPFHNTNTTINTMPSPPRPIYGTVGWFGENGEVFAFPADPADSELLVLQEMYEGREVPASQDDWQAGMDAIDEFDWTPQFPAEAVENREPLDVSVRPTTDAPRITADADEQVQVVAGNAPVVPVAEDMMDIDDGHNQVNETLPATPMDIERGHDQVIETQPILDETPADVVQQATDPLPGCEDVEMSNVEVDEQANQNVSEHTSEEVKEQADQNVTQDANKQVKKNVKKQGKPANLLLPGYETDTSSSLSELAEDTVKDTFGTKGKQPVSQTPLRTSARLLSHPQDAEVETGPSDTATSNTAAEESDDKTVHGEKTPTGKNKTLKPSSAGKKTPDTDGKSKKPASNITVPVVPSKRKAAAARRRSTRVPRQPLVVESEDEDQVIVKRPARKKTRFSTAVSSETKAAPKDDADDENEGKGTQETRRRSDRL